MAPQPIAPAPAPALLLLPAPPTPCTRLALHSSYHAPLVAVLDALCAAAPSPRRRPVLLVVAVAAPILARRRRQPAASVVRWRAAQSLLAGVYSLLAALCAERSIDTDMGAATPRSVDARVVLVDHARGRTYQPRCADDGRPHTWTGTPVLDLAGFATAVTGPWDTIYHPSSEAGYELLRAYLTLAEGRQVIRQRQIVSVPGGISISPSAGAPDEADEADKSYETVILGGTFDHLHPGHKLLLHGTVLLLRLPAAGTTTPPGTLIIGVSGDPMLQSKKFASELESWDTRCRSVLSFLATTLNVTPPSAGDPHSAPNTGSYRVEHVAAGLSGGPEMHGVYADGAVRVRCTVLNDAFGPTVDERPIGAICVSGETRGGGRAVNDKREAKGWHALDVYEVDVLDTRGMTDGDGPGDDNFAAKISSTAIRQQRAEAKAKTKAQI